jgi:protein SCO1
MSIRSGFRRVGSTTAVVIVVHLAGCTELSVSSGSVASCCGTSPDLVSVTSWQRPETRKTMVCSQASYEDQSGGTGVIADLLNKPTLVAFFYSRCQNGAKCSATAAHLAALQADLKRLQLEHQVRLLMITYEPQHDSPARLHQFGADRGFEFNGDALAIRLTTDHERFVDELQAPVNFNSGWVNTHGVELNLFDAHKRLVRKYHTVIWSNEMVVADVRLVLAER